MSEFDTNVMTESEAKLENPPLFKVLLHNDDFTTMEFVIYVLLTIFHKSEADAFYTMMKVHQEGVGVAGIYTYEIANMKAEKTLSLARTHEFPLLCTVEEE